MPAPESVQGSAALIAACDRICGVRSNYHKDRCPLYRANCEAMRTMDAGQQMTAKEGLAASTGTTSWRDIPGDYYVSRDCADPGVTLLHVFAPDHREVAVLTREQAARLGSLLSDEDYENGPR